MVQFKTLETPARDFRPFRVVIIGAGLSGIHLSALFHQFSHNVNLTIYDRAHEPGGTWQANTYPGVACDLPSHGYTLSWAPWAEWQKFQAPGSDCYKYTQFAAKKAHLFDYARFNSNVVKCIWQEEEGVWELTLEDTKTGKTFTDRANVVINASGALSQPKFPNIPGLEKFKGVKAHSAKWDHSVDLSGKRIGLVGAGSSAIQMLTEFQKKGSLVHQYIRSSCWIVPPMGHFTREKFNKIPLELGYWSDIPEYINPVYTDEMRKTFREDVLAHQEHRKDLLAEFNGGFAAGMTIKNSPANNQIWEDFIKMTKDQLQKKPELKKYFIPDWAPGCRRITPGIGYLRALQEDNVEVIGTAVVGVDETGLIGGDGKHREYDVIAFATGFNNTFATPWECVGRNGTTLHGEEYASDAKAYLTAHNKDMPNYFTVGGPNLMSINGDFLGGLEKICNHIFKFVVKLQRDRYKSVCVHPEAVDDFTTWAHTYLERTVHADKCSSWYKNGTTDGKIRGVWPGTSLHMYEALADPKWEEFTWERLSAEKVGPAKYNYLGNGRTVRETNGGDLAYYIEPIASDDTPVKSFDPKEPYVGQPPI